MGSGHYRDIETDFSLDDDEQLKYKPSFESRIPSPFHDIPTIDGDTSATAFPSPTTLADREFAKTTMPAAPVRLPSFSATRAKSYVYRLPLFTGLIVFITVATWVVGALLRSKWDIQAWGALVPDEVGFATLYRTNTYPFVHLNFFHMIINVIAVTPFLERFESEFGTLTSLALFFGPFSTLPAALYMLFEKAILRSNNGVMGASVWFFLLLGAEAIRTYRNNPHFTIATYNIPTWITPLLLAFVISALVPSTSLLGHLCGLVVGYASGLGYLKFLSPPEKALRWIEGTFSLMQRLPRYVSVDQKTYGRFGVLPTVAPVPGVALGVVA